ncbi:unnamed protein product [Prunus armeniaca]|uniref:Uncharacterized protein n=1 Tax=Prunus armeniaca TaxID=36596 RepID=A0A6J5VQC1_PRUAR|nr:unnamed protein product [Prunus armeniaca]CAB4318477.1 unnamed protein product [Prunus armeniaca]
METIEAYRLINVFVGDFSRVEDARERRGGSEAPLQPFSVFSSGGPGTAVSLWAGPGSKFVIFRVQPNNFRVGLVLE